MALAEKLEAKLREVDRWCCSNTEHPQYLWMSDFRDLLDEAISALRGHPPLIRTNAISGQDYRGLR